jgi:hypothetical protein
LGGTTLLGTGEVEVGAHDVEETGGGAPTGRARRQSAPSRTQIRGDERIRRGARSGTHGEEAIQGRLECARSGRVVGSAGTEGG